MRDFDDPRKQGHNPEAASGGKPGVKTRVESRYGGVQRARAPSPTYGHLSLVPGPVMPENVFDTFALHLDPVQRVAEATALGLTDPAAVHAAAARGTSGPATTLPHVDAIQRSFGPDHDVSGIQAHVGGGAATAATAIGARAYATGNRVAFASAPDLHTAAHEAAHIVQQRGGVQLAGGVGQAGDPYEQHADAVADAVVAGRSAAELLTAGPSGGSASHAVQRTPVGGGPVTSPDEADDVDASPAGALDGPVSSPDQVVDGVPATGNASAGNKDKVSGQVGAPHRSHEIIYSFRRGDAALTFKLKAKLGDSAAANGSGSLGRLSGDLKALESKMTYDLSRRSAEFSTTLVQSEFSLELWEGIKLGIKFAGPSAELGTGRITVAKIAVVGKGDVTNWVQSMLGVQFIGAVQLQLEIEGSYSITGELLAKLLEADEVARRLMTNLAHAEAVADDLAAAAKQESELVKKKAELKAKKAAAKNASKTARNAMQREIDQIDDQLKKVRGRMSKRAADLRKLQSVLVGDAKRLTQIDSQTKSKLGKKLLRRFGVKFAGRAAKVVAKLVPVLNVISIAADVVEIIQVFLKWRDSGFAMPKFSLDGGGDGSVSDSEDGGPAIAGVGGEPDGGVGDGGASPDADPDAGAGGGDVDGGSGDGGSGDGSAGDAAGEGAGDSSGEGGTKPPPLDGPIDDGKDIAAARAAMHPAAREFAAAAGASHGVRLNADQLRAIAKIVPTDLDFAKAFELAKQLRGDASTSRATTPYQVIAAIERVVRGLREAPEVVSVLVNGEQRDDLAPANRETDEAGAGPVSDPDQTAEPVRDPAEVDDQVARRDAEDRDPGRSAKPPRGGRGRRGAAGASSSRSDRPGARPRAPQPPAEDGEPQVSEGDVEKRVRVVGGTLDTTALREWAAAWKLPQGGTVGRALVEVKPGAGTWTLKLVVTIREASRRRNLVWDFFVTVHNGRPRAEAYVDAGEIDLRSP